MTAVSRAGLTGYRYLLAVAGLVALSWVPMLVAVVAGAATLNEPGVVPVPVEVTPFVSHVVSSTPVCPGLPPRPE